MREDLFLHFVGGTVIMSVLSMFFLSMGINPWFAFGVVVGIAGSKELVYDKLLGKGTPDIWDFMYTVFPALLILFVALL